MRLGGSHSAIGSATRHRILPCRRRERDRERGLQTDERRTRAWLKGLEMARGKVGYGNETAFVTGGGSGIGLAVVHALLDEGWHVVVADLAQGSLDNVRRDLGGEAARIRFEALDVTDEEGVRRAIARCDAEFGPLTGLVNSAGIGADVACLETSTALFRKMVEVNLIGSFVASREAALHMRARDGGSIVNIASVSGIRGNSGRVAYGASKAAVIHMTKVMAVELAPLGIRVNAIAPGPVETPMVTEVHTAQARAEWMRTVPQHRYGTPEELAGAAMFLLNGGKSSFITGQTICVDGGFTAAGRVHPAV
jgi:NAD(P)-dependent dehydrogenase (short-subunit alcohol dehydrogenase family)